MFEAPLLRRGAAWAALGVAAAALLLTAPGRAAAGGFLASLRIERPKAVSPSLTLPTGADRTLSLSQLVAHMAADHIEVTRDEADRPVASAADAARAVGFAPRLPASRTDEPTFTVTGARTVTLDASLRQLRTILGEAGQSPDLPASLDGMPLSLGTPRGIRAQYGHCPEMDTSIQGQLQGPPPTTAANADCVILTQVPVTAAALPTGLDIDVLLDVALQLAGLSPDETRQLRQVFDAPTALSLVLPRFIRSQEVVDVGAGKGILLHTGGRRGPSYALVWEAGGRIYTLSGYGSPADAVPLARSLS